MSWEALTAIGTVLSAVIILFTVILGVRQLEQIRKATQFDGVMKVAERCGTDRYQNALHFVRFELEERLADPAFRAELKTPARNDETRHPEIIVLLEHELIGTYIKHGLLSGSTIYDLMGARLVAAWRKLKPVVEIARVTGGNSAWENAEYLSRQAELWIQRHSRS